MKKTQLSILFLFSIFAVMGQQTTYTLSPTNKATQVNPDTHIELSFNEKPTLGNSGQIKIYDASNMKLIDVLDMSIPAGPTQSVNHGNAVPPYSKQPYPYTSDHFTNANTKPGTPSGEAVANSDTFQLNIIGRFSDAFHFYPVIIRDNTATIYLHNNLLTYGKTYVVQIDPQVFSLKSGKFAGIKGSAYKFSTKKTAPAINAASYTVSKDGKADFNTVQAAVDYIPDFSNKRTTIYIKNGFYEEIVYFKNKTNIAFVGESRDKTVVSYANNEVFNPHPSNISTNERPGTFPSRRAAFAADNCSGLHFSNFTIQTTAKGQAEGFLIMGKENILQNMHIIGSGDALQANGSVYLDNCKIDGDGDTFLSRGPAFFYRCEISSVGTFAWMRNTAENHGAMLLECKLKCRGNDTEMARAPSNKGKEYPYCEMVLISCQLQGISPVGWGDVSKDASNVHYWEYNSTNLADGKPIDSSRRHPASRQLTLEKDKETIKNYSIPAFILGGWTPKMEKTSFPNNKK